LGFPGIGGGYARTYLLPVVVLGLGMALTIAPLTTTVMNAVDRDHAGTASGINNAVARGAGLIAIAVMGVVMVWVFERRLEALLAPLPLAPEARAALEAQRTRLGAIEIPDSIAPDLRARVAAAIHAAFLSGFRVVTGLAAVSAAASAGM